MTAPVVSNYATLIIAPSGPTTSLGISLPTDADGDGLTVTLNIVPADGLTEYWNGSDWIAAGSGDILTAQELASLRYTPPADAMAGPETLKYSVSDGTSTVSGQMSISDSGGDGHKLYLLLDGELGVQDTVGHTNAILGYGEAGHATGFQPVDGEIYFSAWSDADSGYDLYDIHADGSITTLTSDGGVVQAQDHTHFASLGDGTIAANVLIGGEVAMAIFGADGSTRDVYYSVGGDISGDTGLGVLDGTAFFNAALQLLSVSEAAGRHGYLDADNRSLTTDNGADGGFITFNDHLIFNAVEGDSSYLFDLTGRDVSANLVRFAPDSLAHVEGVDSGFDILGDELLFNASVEGDPSSLVVITESEGGELGYSHVELDGAPLVDAGAHGGFVNIGDTAYFSATTDAYGNDLYAYADGVVTAIDLAAGEAGVFGSEAVPMVAFDDHLFVTDQGGQLWEVDGSGERHVVDLQSGEFSFHDAGVSGGFHEFDGQLYFNAVNGEGDSYVLSLSDRDQVTVYLGLPGAGSTGYAVGEGAPLPVSFTGGFGNDIIVSDDAGESLSGAGGNDLLYAGNGNDTLDGGTGTDTASFAHVQTNCQIDLGEGGAYGYGAASLVSIENVIGSDWDDQITGDGAANSLAGAGGNDTFYASGGQDTLNGGEGFDTVDYSDSAVGVTVNLTSGYGTDILVSIEQVFGSQHDDVLVAGAGYSELYGDYGDDHLFAAGNGANGDWLDGGEGIDTADYSNATTGVTAELDGGKRGAPAPGSFDGDVLVNIENLVGSDFSDHLTGNEADNVLTGGAGDDALIGLDGNDTLYGGDGDDTLYGGPGDDHFDGGTGVNTVSFNGVSAGETVDLAAGTATGSAGGADTLVAIQNVVGSLYGDVISGDLGANLLDGDHGDDHLFGLGGADTLVGGQGSDTLAGGYGADVLTGAVGNDTFVFGSVGEVRSGEDLITDLTNNDVIDLSGLDAKGQKPGHQAFHLVDAFDGHKAEMTVSYDADSNRTLLLFDTNKDGVGDMSIAISGDHTDFSHFIF